MKKEEIKMCTMIIYNKDTSDKITKTGQKVMKKLLKIMEEKK